MFKSTLGIAISNFIMIWIVLLNSKGSGWEVSANTMQDITMLLLFLLICFIFSTTTLLLSLKQFIRSCNMLRISYVIFFTICVLFMIFLFFVEAFTGQFWIEKFPNMLFVTVSSSINILFIFLISIGRFRPSPSNIPCI